LQQSNRTDHLSYAITDELTCISTASNI